MDEQLPRFQDPGCMLRQVCRTKTFHEQLTAGNHRGSMYTFAKLSDVLQSHPVHLTFVFGQSETISPPPLP